MTAYVLVMSDPDPAGAESRQTYSDGVRPLLATAGATSFLGASVVKTQVGPERSGVATVFQFPDVAQATAFFEQEAYQDLIPFREKGFRHMEILILDALL